MPDLVTLFDMLGPLGNWPKTDDLASAVSPACIAYTSSFLASQMLTEISSECLICIDMAIDRLVADWDFGRNLFSAPLVFQITFYAESVGRFDLAGITAVQRSLFRQNARLSGPISSQTRIAGNIPTNCRLIPPEIKSNLGLV